MTLAQGEKIKWEDIIPLYNKLNTGVLGGGTLPAGSTGSFYYTYAYGGRPVYGLPEVVVPSYQGLARTRVALDELNGYVQQMKNFNTLQDITKGITMPSVGSKLTSENIIELDRQIGVMLQAKTGFKLGHHRYVMAPDGYCLVEAYLPNPITDSGVSYQVNISNPPAGGPDVIVGGTNAGFNTIWNSASSSGTYYIKYTCVVTVQATTKPFRVTNVNAGQVITVDVGNTYSITMFSSEHRIEYGLTLDLDTSDTTQNTLKVHWYSL